MNQSEEITKLRAELEAARTENKMLRLAGVLSREHSIHESAMEDVMTHAREDELCTKKPQSFQSAPVTDKRRQVSVKVVYLTGPVVRPVDNKCGIR